MYVKCQTFLWYKIPWMKLLTQSSLTPHLSRFAQYCPQNKELEPSPIQDGQRYENSQSKKKKKTQLHQHDNDYDNDDDKTRR